MKIAIFGATGKTGIQVVEQALTAGHGVKAFVRDLNKMSVTDEKLEIVKGDILDAESVNAGVAGVDAVILALGSDKPILAQGTTNIINAMEKHGVKRIIVESSYPMSGSPEGMEFLKGVGMNDEQIAAARLVIDDKVAQEKGVRESGLDWIIVRPLILTDGSKTGQYRVGEVLDIKPGDTISRADVADFMLKQLISAEWLGKIAVISY